MKRILTILILLIPVLGFAQEEKKKKNIIFSRDIPYEAFSNSSGNRCMGDIAEAERLYLNGEFNSSLFTLLSIDSYCKGKKFGQLIYELTIRNYLAMDKIFEADTLFKKLLKKFPDYEPTATGIEENYIRMFNQYKVVPKITLSTNFERIVPRFDIVGDINSLNDEYDYSKPLENNGFSYSIGNSLAFSTKKQWRVIGSWSYRVLKIKKDIIHKYKPEFLTRYAENSDFASLGLDLSHYHISKKLNLFYGLGVHAFYLIKSDGVVQAAIPDYNLGTNSSSFLVPDNGFDLRYEMDMKPYRRNLTIIPRFFVGLEYNLNKKWTASLSYTYEYSLNPYTGKNLFFDEEIMLKTYFVESNNFYKAHLLKLGILLNISNHVINKYPMYAK